MHGVLSQSTFSLSSSPTQYPLSGALTRHRPIKSRFVDSLGCSLEVVLISQRPYTTSQTDEELDKSTISLILFISTYTHNLPLSPSLFLNLSLPPSLLPSPIFPFPFLTLSFHLPLAPSFCLSPAPAATAKVNNLKRCRHSYRPRARNPYRENARLLEFAEPQAKMRIFLDHSL